MKRVEIEDRAWRDMVGQQSRFGDVFGGLNIELLQC